MVLNDGAVVKMQSGVFFEVVMRETAVVGTSWC